MNSLYKICDNLLLEQDTKLSVLKKAISERLPVSIYYKGPPNEVREGQRIDIEPIVLGKHKKTDNLVMWAYTFKGVSKKGLPNWKMYRVDRILSAKLNPNAERFKLGDLPGYVKGKAPSMMKSLSSIEIFSPYWFDEKERYIDEPYPTEVPIQKEPKIEIPVSSPIVVKPSDEQTIDRLGDKIYNELTPQIRDIDGEKVVSKKEYDMALNNFYGYQLDQFKNRQKLIGGNQRPGEGTRKRFTDTSKFELDKLLVKNNVKVVEDTETIEENRRIILRFKRLIN